MTGEEIRDLVWEMVYLTDNQDARGFLRSASALLLMAFTEDRDLEEMEIIPVMLK